MRGKNNSAVRTKEWQGRRIWRGKSEYIPKREEGRSATDKGKKENLTETKRTRIHRSGEVEK